MSEYPDDVQRLFDSGHPALLSLMVQMIEMMETLKKTVEAQQTVLDMVLRELRARETVPSPTDHHPYHVKDNRWYTSDSEWDGSVTWTNTNR